MKIMEFGFDQELVNRFLDFPRRLYASDSNWIPDPAEIRFLSDSESRSVRSRNFLVIDGDEVCGRVTAIINSKLCDDNNRPYGQLGFFECVDDLQIARLLVDSATAWLSANLPGGGIILAPMNFDTWHPYRLRTKGFGEPTFFMEPYNPPYYPTLFASLNFAPVSQYITKAVANLPALLAFWKPYHDNALAKRYKVRSFDLSAISSEMSIIYHLSLATFRKNLFFTEISEAEFRALYAGMAGNLDPDLFLFLLDPENKPVGLCFAMADHRLPDIVNVKTFGILPHIHHEGVGAAFAYETYRRFQLKGFLSVNHCLMRAGNRADGFDGGLGAVTREYSLYSRSF